MGTAYCVNARCLLVKDQAGRTNHYYHPDSGLSSVIPWLSEEQAEQFLAEGWVTPIEVQTDAEAETKVALDRVAECVEALAATDLPPDCGAPKAREALRDNGHKFGNDTIAAAIRIRRGVSGTPTHADATA